MTIFFAVSSSSRGGWRSSKNLLAPRTRDNRHHRKFSRLVRAAALSILLSAVANNSNGGRHGGFVVATTTTSTTTPMKTDHVVVGNHALSNTLLSEDISMMTSSFLKGSSTSSTSPPDAIGGDRDNTSSLPLPLALTRSLGIDILPLKDITGNAAKYTKYRCQGDCDSDDDCNGFLKCFQRTYGDPGPPGCTGTPTGAWDYCYDRNEYSWPVEHISPHGTRLGRCEGDCDSDSDCNGSMKCFQRTYGDPGPPGCSGTPIGAWDYCYSDELTRPFDEISADGTNLGECEGDCDDHDDCAGDLLCYQRNAGDPGPPGCTGIPHTSWDYCYKNRYLVKRLGSEHGGTYGSKMCEGACHRDEQCEGDLKCYYPDPYSSEERKKKVPGCRNYDPSRNKFYHFCYDPRTLDYISDHETNLKLCQGDCDADDDCIGHLRCYQRDTGDPVPPGCTGSPISNNDYCYDSSTSAPTNAPTETPTVTPTDTPTATPAVHFFTEDFAEQATADNKIIQGRKELQVGAPGKTALNVGKPAHSNLFAASDSTPSRRRLATTEEMLDMVCEEPAKYDAVLVPDGTITFTETSTIKIFICNNEKEGLAAAEYYIEIPTPSPTSVPTFLPTAAPTVSPTLTPTLTPYNFDIIRYGNVRIENSTDGSTDKVIAIDYQLQDTRFNHDTVNITIFEEDCATVLGPHVLPREDSSVGKIVTLDVTYDPVKVGASSIWKAVYNDANPSLETGGNFTFCVRASTLDEQSGYEMDFNETKFFVNVDKTTGAGFELLVDVDRDEVGDEDAGTVNYSGSVKGFQCDVLANDFVEKKVAVGQGEALGLCVNSATNGISVAGWQSLTLKRDGIEFDAISNGRVPDALENLVDTDCSNAAAGCDAQVDLIALFFQSDGNLTVEGTVVLEIEGDSSRLRRRLANLETVITKNNNEYPTSRELEDMAVEGSFGISVPVATDAFAPSGSISFSPSSSCIVSLMILLASATMMVANVL